VVVPALGLLAPLVGVIPLAEAPVVVLWALLPLALPLADGAGRAGAGVLLGAAGAGVLPAPSAPRGPP
jgi:hypothetical protein